MISSRTTAWAVTMSVVLALLGSAPSSADTAAATPPELRSVSISPAVVHPGDTLEVVVDAVSETPLTTVRVDLEFPDATTGIILQSLNRSSTLTRQVTAAWPEGGARIARVYLANEAGFLRNYARDGTVVTSPGMTTSNHSVDLLTQSVTVVGGADRTPPVLTSFRWAAQAAWPDEPTGFTWAVEDGGSGPASVTATWRERRRGSAASRVFDATGTSTTGELAFPEPGFWDVVSVRVADVAGNTRTYLPNGTWSMTGWRGTHDLALGGQTTTVAPLPPYARVHPRAGRLTVWVMGQTLDTSSYRITAEPLGVQRTGAIPEGGAVFVDLGPAPYGVSQRVSVTAVSETGTSRPVVLSATPRMARFVTGVRDFTGDGRVDVVAQTNPLGTASAAVTLYAGTGAGLKAGTRLVAGDQAGCLGISAVDTVYTVGREFLCAASDLVALTPPGGGGVLLGTRGWETMRWVDGGFSLDADRIPDVLAMDSAGRLLLYRKTSQDRLLPPVRIGSGWQSMLSVVSAGDLTGDRRNDIVAVDTAGRLWLYPGNGRGGFTARRQIGSGWTTMGAVVPLLDFDGDGRTDLGGITLGGELRLYRGTGHGTLRPGVVIGTGWQKYF